MAHINTGWKHTIYFFNILVLDGLQHNFSFLFFYKIFAIGLIDGIMLFFTHFKICLDGKIDFFLNQKMPSQDTSYGLPHVCVITDHNNKEIDLVLKVKTKNE